MARNPAALADAGAREIGGPSRRPTADSYAVFFEDPCGNRLEVCHRLAG